MEEDARASTGRCRGVVFDENALTIQLVLAPHALGTVPVFADGRTVEHLVVALRLTVIHAFGGFAQREVRQSSIR